MPRSQHAPRLRQVALEGLQYVQFQLMLRLFDFRVCANPAGVPSRIVHTHATKHGGVDGFSRTRCAIAPRWQVQGRLKLRAKPDFSSIVLSFNELPKLRLRTECNVSWGVVPLPLQDYLESVVKQEVSNWLANNVVYPNEYEINPPNFQPKQGITEEDVMKATRAVVMMRHYSAVNDV